MLSRGRLTPRFRDVRRGISVTPPGDSVPATDESPVRPLIATKRVNSGGLEFGNVANRPSERLAPPAPPALGIEALLERSFCFKSTVVKGISRIPRLSFSVFLLLGIATARGVPVKIFYFRGG